MSEESTLENIEAKLNEEEIEEVRDKANKEFERRNRQSLQKELVPQVGGISGRSAEVKIITPQTRSPADPYGDSVYLELNHNHGLLYMMISDISGRDLPEFVWNLQFKAVIDTIVKKKSPHPPSPKYILNVANRMLAPYRRNGTFITATVAAFDLDTHYLKFANAGSTRAIRYAARVDDISTHNQPGIAMGFDKGPIFERTLREAGIQLEVGDIFLLYTKGIVDQENEDGELFGDERLAELVYNNHSKTAEEFIGDALVPAIGMHRGKAEIEGDYAMIILKIKEEPPRTQDAQKKRR